MGAGAEVQLLWPLPQKPSSLSGPQKLNLNARAQLRVIGWGKLVGLGRQMFPWRHPPTFNRLSLGVVSFSGSRSELHGGRKTLQRRQAGALQQALLLQST